MKLVNYIHRGQQEIGYLVDHKVLAISACVKEARRARVRSFSSTSVPTSITDLVKKEKYDLAKRAFDFAADNPRRIQGESLERVKVLPPVQPSKVFWLDGNYPIHNLWEDRGLPLPTDFDTVSPLFYIRPASSVVGHCGAIILPKIVDKAWASAELGLVIGKEAKDVKVGKGAEHILGYTISFDVASDVNWIDGRKVDIYGNREWSSLFGKWLDTFSPIGPCLVPREYIDVTRLRIVFRLNGSVVQDFSTKDMFFSMEDIVETASKLMVLNPGDLFETGSSRREPFELKHEDILEAEIENIGKLRVRVKRELKE